MEAEGGDEVEGPEEECDGGADEEGEEGGEEEPFDEEAELAEVFVEFPAGGGGGGHGGKVNEGVRLGKTTRGRRINGHGCTRMGTDGDGTKRR